MIYNLPHPIPYQGSKRQLAPIIARYFPEKIKRFYEPFSGSAAMTIYAATFNHGERYIIGDSLEPIISLWEEIILSPVEVANRYAEVWNGQLDATDDYFNRIRDRYNNEPNSVDLLYLICRCVKNAVRFNKHGRFTQSHDKRRLGMRPEKMISQICAVSNLLRGKIEFRKGDWLKTVEDANPEDFIYMDPPYFGTSVGRDKRYFQQLDFDVLVNGIDLLQSKDIPFTLSYDGMTGDREYSPTLPEYLNLTRILINAGRSSQSTLHGRAETTFESLYLPHYLAKKLNVTSGVINRPTQGSLL